MNTFFFFNDTATTEIYTLSLHDALPICVGEFLLSLRVCCTAGKLQRARRRGLRGFQDRKSTRLNSSHSQISYAVFCLTKKLQQLVSLVRDWPSDALCLGEVIPGCIRLAC